MNDANAKKIVWRRTQNGTTYLPAPDRLWRDAPAPLRALYNVLGVPLEFVTNAPALEVQAQETFGDWGVSDAAPATEPMRLQVYLHDIGEESGPDGSPALLTRVQKDYLLVSGGNSFGFADRAAGFAAAFVTPETMADSQRMQVCFLECLGMYVVCRERPIMLHAAAVIHENRCVLLTGSEGVGKSTLTYACLRAGFRLLAEDVVFAATAEASFDIWGNPWYLHLLPDAPRFFPELNALPLTPMLNGEQKLRLKVNTLYPGAAVPHHSVWAVCSLSRVRSSKTRLLPGDKRTIHRLLTTFKGDPPMNRAAQEQAVKRLLEGRTMHLEIGSDPAETAAVLRQWIEGE